MIEYFEQKWQFIANLKQRIRIFFIDVKGRQSVDMVSTFPLISVGETLSLHPSVLAYQNCSSSPKDKVPLVTESDVLIIQMFYSLRNGDVMQSTIDLTLTTSIRGGAHTLKSEIASRGTKVKKHSSPKSKIYPVNPYETYPVGRPRTAVSKLHDENQNFDLAISSMQNFSHRNKVKGGKSVPKFDSSMTPVALQHFNKAPIQICSSEFSQSLWNQGDSDSFVHAHGNENGHGGTLDFSTGTTGHDLKMFEANHDKPAFHAASTVTKSVAQPYTCMNSIFSPIRSSITEMGCCDINDCTQDIIDGIANGLIHITSSSSNAPLCQSPSCTSTRAMFDRIILREEEQQQLPVLTDCGFHSDTADDVITLAPAPPLMPEISPVSLQPRAMPLDSSDAFTYNISACELPSNSLVMCDGGGILGSRDVSAFNVSDPFHDIDFPFSEVKERKDYQDPLFFFSNIGNGFSFRNGNNDSPQGDQRIGVDRSDMGFSNDLDILMGGHNYPELPSVGNICMSGGILCSVNSTACSEPSLNAIACEKARQDSLAITSSSFPSSSSTMPVTLPSCQPLLDSSDPVLECAPQGHIDRQTAQLGALAAPAHKVFKTAGLTLKIRIPASENDNSVPIPIPVPVHEPAIIPISISVPVPVPVPVPDPLPVPLSTPTLPSVPVYVPVSIPVPTHLSVPIFANDPRGATVKTAEIFNAVGSAGAGAVNGMVFSPSSSMMKPSVVVPLAGVMCAPTAGSVTAVAIAADSEKSETPREVMQKMSAVRLFGYIEQIDEIRYRDDFERRSPLLCGTITKERTDSVSVSTKSLSPSYKSNQVNEVRNRVTNTVVVNEIKQHLQHVHHAQHVKEVNAAVKGIKVSDASTVAADNLLNSSKGIPYLDQEHLVDNCEKERNKNKDSRSGLSTSRKDGIGSRSSTLMPAILTSPSPISLPPPSSSTSSSSSSSSPPLLLLSPDMSIGRPLNEETSEQMCESSMKKMRVKSVGGPSSSYPTMDTLDLVHDGVPPTALRKKRDREDEDKNGNQDESEYNNERDLGMCNRTPVNDAIISPRHNAGINVITVAAAHVEAEAVTVTGTGTGTGTGTETETGEEENERSRVADSLTTVNSPAGLTLSLSKPSPQPVSSCSYLFPHQTFQDSSSDSNSSNGAAESSDGSNAADSFRNIRIPENFRLFYTEINDIIMISSRIKCLSKKDGKGRRRLTPTFLVPLSMKDKYVEHLVFMNTFQ